MNVLSEFNFSPATTNILEVSMPDKIKLEMKEHKELVKNNISYLKEIGIENYEEVFVTFYDMFLLDASTFKAIFDKYEPDDLIAKVKKNHRIVEVL
jgi:hypothetical protein